MDNIESSIDMIMNDTNDNDVKEINMKHYMYFTSLKLKCARKDRTRGWKICMMIVLLSGSLTKREGGKKRKER